jgi:hypothetical protein
MRTPNVRNERGIALVVAIVALVVIGAMVAGTFFISNVEQKTSLNTVATAQAFEAAEAGMAKTMGNWTPLSYTPGTDVVLPVSAALGGSAATYQVTVSPINGMLLLVKATGTDKTGGATQTLASLVRLNTADVNPGAAITTTQAINFNGASYFINGNDSVPQGWSNCPPGHGNQVGIRTSSNNFHTGNFNNNQQNNIIGSGGTPSAVTHDNTITNSTFNDFGDMTYSQMAAGATIQFASSDAGPYQPAPVASGSPAVCTYSNTLNWGEPLRTGTGLVPSCNNYFPTIHANGNLTLNGGGRGQGVLLVDGNLSVYGGFQFYGLVIVKGQLNVGGTGGNDAAKLVGAVMAQNVNVSDQSVIQGNASIQFSYCAVQQALNGSASPVPVTGRAWTQMY